MKKSKKFNDYIYSILASSLPLILVQLLFIPFYAHRVNIEIFGNFILILTFVTMSSTILGNTLNNIRLTKNEGVQSEFEFLNFLLILSFFQQIILSIFLFINHTSLSEYLQISAWAFFLLFKTYLLVYYRVVINYRSYLISSIVNIIFISIAYLFFYYNLIGIYAVYLIGEFSVVIYILKEQKIFKNKYYYAVIKRKDISNYFYLMIANILNNILIYADRIIISYFLGKSYLTIIFIVTALPKMMSIIINPIANVILSYKMKEKVTKNKMSITFILKGIVFILISTCFISICSYIFIKLFYNKYFSETLDLIFIASLSSILFSTSSIVQLDLIAKQKFKAILLITGVPLGFLLALCYLIVPLYNIKGYIYSFLIISIFKHILIIYLNKSKIERG